MTAMSGSVASAGLFTRVFGVISTFGAVPVAHPASAVAAARTPTTARSSGRVGSAGA
jgi:hypothetical protein